MVAPAPGSECSSLSAKRQRCDDAPEALSGWSTLPPTKTLALLLSGRPIPIQIRRRDARPCWPPLALKPTRCSAVGALGGGAARSCGAQLAGPRARPAQKCFSWCTGGVDNSACAPGYRRTPWAGVALAVTLAKRTTLLIRARRAQTLARWSVGRGVQPAFVKVDGSADSGQVGRGAPCMHARTARLSCSATLRAVGTGVSFSCTAHARFGSRALLLVARLVAITSRGLVAMV